MAEGSPDKMPAKKEEDVSSRNEETEMNDPQELDNFKRELAQLRAKQHKNQADKQREGDLMTAIDILASVNEVDEDTKKLNRISTELMNEGEKWQKKNKTALRWFLDLFK